jgi:hypothetical protein
MNYIRISIFFLSLLLVVVFVVGMLVGEKIGKDSAKESYNIRCMKYFGNKGYPADGYCKLFIGEIKARDE